jgi:hypothetical protein
MLAEQWIGRRVVVGNDHHDTPILDQSNASAKLRLRSCHSTPSHRFTTSPKKSSDIQVGSRPDGTRAVTIRVFTLRELQLTNHKPDEGALLRY